MYRAVRKISAESPCTSFVLDFLDKLFLILGNFLYVHFLPLSTWPNNDFKLDFWFTLLDFSITLHWLLFKPSWTSAFQAPVQYCKLLATCFFILHYILTNDNINNSLCIDKLYSNGLKWGMWPPIYKVWSDCPSVSNSQLRTAQPRWGLGIDLRSQIIQQLWKIFHKGLYITILIFFFYLEVNL